MNPNLIFVEMNSSYLKTLIVLFGLFLACSNPKPINQLELSPEFKSHWYSDQASVSTYNLKQARYGEIHQGEAAIIFVTEPFSKSKQVKLDYPDKHVGDQVSTLKCNFTKKFNTGIYPYSMMMSSFQPLQGSAKTLKVTTSAQEWCGHTFSQLNLKPNGYLFQLHSYFESEGEQKEMIKGEAWLEDAIWQHIKLSPKKLPVGQISMIPGMMYARLRHHKMGIQQVLASLTEVADGQYVYILEYLELDRKLSIYIDQEFPYKITGWEEVNRSGFGPKAPTLVTKATLKKEIMLDYWNRHEVKDSVYQKLLELDIDKP